MEDIAGIIYAIFAGIVMIIFISAISGVFTDLQCQPYKTKIQQKDSDIAQCNEQLSLTKSELDKSNEKYAELVRENITKKDFEEIKAYYNQTQIKLYYLDQKFDTVNNNFYKIYNVMITKYRISIAINLFFVLDLISLAFFKHEIIFFSVSWIAKKLRRKKET